MLRTMFHAKIHRATVTQADLHYVGSVTVDQDLLDAADIVPGQKVDIADIDNGARLATYTIGDVLVATISERGQASIVAADATFTLIACAGGLLSGIAGWFVLQTRGWVVIAVPPLAAALAGLMTWRVGLVVGSSGFAERGQQAPVGGVEDHDLEVRARDRRILVGLVLPDRE